MIDYILSGPTRQCQDRHGGKLHVKLSDKYFGEYFSAFFPGVDRGLW